MLVSRTTSIEAGARDGPPRFSFGLIGFKSSRQPLTAGWATMLKRYSTGLL